MEQNIVDIGFVPSWKAEMEEATKAALAYYDIVKKIDGTKIAPGSTGGFTELKAKVEELAKSNQALTDSNAKLSQSLADLKKRKAENTEADKQTLSYSEANAKAELERIKAIKQSTQYQEALNKEKAKGIAQAAAEAKIANQVADDYSQLNKALKDAELRYRNLAIATNFQGEAQENALKEALAMRAVLDKVDGNLKNYQRNVGNYKSAFDGLGMSFTQVARELPSLAINAQTFFLAISNNLPMVFDEIKKAKDEIDDLNRASKSAATTAANEARERALAAGATNSQAKAAAKLAATLAVLTPEQLEASVAARVNAENSALAAGATMAQAKAAGNLAASQSAANATMLATPTLMSKIASSIFSLPVVLSILVTLLTVFGSKLIESIAGLFNAEAAIKKYEERLKSLIETQRTLIDLQKAFNESVRPSIDDVNRAEQELVIAQSLGKSRGDLLQIEQKIATARRLAAQDLYLSDGGFDKEADALAKLMKSELEYNDVLDGIAKTKQEQIDLDKAGAKTYGKQFDNAGAYDKEIKKREELADIKEKQYNRDLKNYENIKKINNDNYTTGVALEAKKNEIILYNREQALSKATESAKLEAQAVIDKNERILADERNFEAARIAALNEAAQKRKTIIAQNLAQVAGNPANTNADGTETAELANARKEAAKATAKVEADLQVSIYNVQEEFRKRRLSAELIINKTRISLASETAKIISDSEAKSFDERILAYGDYYLNEQELIKADAAFQRATKIMTSEELIALTEETNKKLVELAIKSKKDLAEIFISDENGVVSLAESMDKLQLSKDELALFKKLQNKKKYAEESKKLELEQQKLTIQKDIYSQNAIIAHALTTEEQKKAAKKRLIDDQAKLNSLELSIEVDKEQKRLTIKEFYYQLELKAVQTLFTLAQKLSDAASQERIKQLEEEAKLIDKNHTKEIQAINESTISAQEKAAQITMLDAQVAAKKQEIANKEKEEKIKQAQTDKALTVAKIAIEGALAVVHAYTTGGVYAAALAAVGVAAELAIAIATPIPTYAEGGTHPGGPAIYGEAGPELVKEPGKAAYLVDKPTLGILPSGTVLKPMGDMVNESMHSLMIKSWAEPYMVQKIDSGLKEIKEAIIEQGYYTQQAIKNQRRGNVNIQFSGMFGQYLQKKVIN